MDKTVSLLNVSLGDCVAPVFFAVCPDIFAMLVLPEKAVMGGEERVLVEEVDEVNNVKDNFNMIAIFVSSAILIIIIITRSTSVCANTQREARQCGAQHHFSSNWSELFSFYRNWSKDYAII